MSQVLTFVQFLQKSPFNLALFAIMVVSGVLLLWSFISRIFTGQAPKVNTAGAVLLMNRSDAVVLDIRPQGEYEKGHIAGARHLSLSTSSEFEQRIAELEKFKERPIIVNDQFGNQSLVAVAKLKKQGFEVYSLQGGFDAWRQANLPVEKK